MKFKRLRLKKTFNGNLKAVSPVIATIIIVAIAITMSIAVAYWLLGLGSSFTKFEKVEFTTAYVTGTGVAPDLLATPPVTGDQYVIHLGLKNTGSASATIDTAVTLYNGKPAVAYVAADNDWITLAAGTTSLGMQPGKSANLDVTLNNANGDWVSGMTVEIMLHTTGGKDYPKVIVLP